MLERNQWFQEQTSRWLQKQRLLTPQTTLFSYSYAAEGAFRVAKERGWRTVLGQIDPGPVEERIVIELCRAAGYGSEDLAAPPEYWQAWEREWRLADEIVVNSRWSCEALATEGVPRDKIRVVPLAYDAPLETRGLRRDYPKEFSQRRPLRLLFLGQANIRKGVLPLLESMHLLADEPVELTIVGYSDLGELRKLPATGNVRWRGPVPRSEAPAYYRDADAFVLPTYSDGFALTQLEAQAWRLPLIVSRRCGDVVTPGRNGLLLDEVTGEAIAKAIQEFLTRPYLLTSMSEASGVRKEFSLESIGENLVGIAAESGVAIAGDRHA